MASGVAFGPVAKRQYQNRQGGRAGADDIGVDAHIRVAFELANVQWAVLVAPTHVRRVASGIVGDAAHRAWDVGAAHDEVPL